MDESIFWTKVAAIGQVAGAIATFAAVCVSLWIVHSERRAHIKVRAGLRLVTPEFENVISIRLENHGLRPVRVSTVGWRTGWLPFGPKWLAFRYAVQLFDRPVLSLSWPRLPFDLGPGQEATLFLSPATFKERRELHDPFFGRRLPFSRKATPTKICVVAYLVAAKESMTRVEKRLENFLASGVIPPAARKKAAQQSARD